MKKIYKKIGISILVALLLVSTTIPHLAFAAATETNTVTDTEPPAKPTVILPTNEDTKVRGTAEALSHIRIYNNAKTSVLGEGDTDANGNFEVTIAKQSPGTVIIITATDSSNNESLDTTVYVRLVPITINKVTELDTTVTGTGYPGAKATLTFVQRDGTAKVYEGTVGTDGTYQITIEKQLADTPIKGKQTFGTMTSANTTGTVKPVAIKNTTIKPIKDTDNVVTGTGEPNGKITIKKGDTVLGEGTVGQDGNYSILITPQQAGTEIEAVVEAKGKTAGAKTTVQEDPIAQTTINPVTETDIVVKGTGEPNSPITIKNGDAVIAEGRVDSDGHFQLPIQKQPANDTLVAIVTAKGKTSDASTIVQPVEIAPTTIEPISSESEKAVGTGEPNGTITIKNGDLVIAEGKVGPDGKYSFTIPKQPEGDTITATVVAKGKESAASTIVTHVNIGTITAFDYEIGTDNYVKGKITGDVTKVKIIVNDTEFQAIDVSLPNYQYYAKGKIVKATDKVYAVALDANGKELDRVKVNISKATAGTITANDYEIGTDLYVKGALTGDVAKVKLIINGVEKQAITVTGTSYQYYARDKILQPEDEVYAVALDASGKELDRVKVNISKPTVGTITADNFAVGADSYVKGKITGDVTKVKLIINGVEQQTVNVTVPNYQYHAKNKIVNTTDEVYAVALDANGTELARVKVNIIEPTAGTITANDFTIGTSSYVTGTITGDVAKVKLILNGSEKQTINVPKNNYQYYAKTLITSITDVVYVVALDANGKELDRTLVTIVQKTIAGTIMANNFTKGIDNYVTGTFKGDITRVSLTINGVEYTKINVSGGQYRYYANDKIFSPSDIVVVKGYDASGKLLDSKQIQVLIPPNTSGDVTLTPYKLGSDSYIIGAYTGDVVKVRVKKGDQTYTAIPATNNAFRYYAKNIVTKADDVIFVEGLNSKGDVVSTKQLQIDTTEGRLTADTFKIGTNTYVTGTFEGDTARIGLEVNGVLKNSIPVSGNTYQYYAKNLITAATDIIYAVAYDRNGRELNRVRVAIEDKDPVTGTITLNDFKIGQDTYVTGTFTGDITRVELVINNVAQTRIPATNETINYYAATLITNISDDVKMVGYAADGRIVAEASLNLSAASGTITANNYKITDSYLTGSCTGDVKKVSVEINGIELKTIPVKADETFSYYLKNQITSATANVIVHGKDALGNDLDTTKVTLTE